MAKTKERKWRFGPLGLFRIIPGLLVGLLVLWVGLFVVLAPDLPDTRELFEDARQSKVVLLASDGSLIDERGASGRDYTPLGQMSPHLINAVLATEDRRFFDHFGLDVIGTGRALLENLRSGRYVSGGSTITQQLAKNLYLTPERTLRRKIEELFLALWLEARLSKRQILELYLNRVYLGAGAYGAEAAAQRYFGRHAAELSLPQAAMLAGLLKAPSYYAPTNDLERAQARASLVLRLMVEAGLLEAEAAEEARAAPATLEDDAAGRFAGHFTDHVLDRLTEHLGKPDLGWVVRTTLDPAIQRAAQAAVAANLASHPGLQAAVVVLGADGALRAMIGGEGYSAQSTNRAVAARRQPGSAFKPLVYAAAVDAGWEPDDVIIDEPFTVGDWRPRNAGDRYHGRVTLEQALALSLNTVAVRLARDVGIEEVIEQARSHGIASGLRPLPSLALGTSEVTPLELTAAYQPFASDGLRRPVFTVGRVSDVIGRTLYRHRPVEAPVLSPENARDMREMLRAVVEDGTGRAAALPGRRAYGKTGTTQNSRDAWFVGFAGEHVVGVWVGRDDGLPMAGINGANLPAVIWRDIFMGLPQDRLVAEVVQPARKPAARERMIEDATDYALHMVWRWMEDLLGESGG